MIVPKLNASQRTKNRLREHKIGVDTLMFNGRIAIFKGNIHKAFRCRNHCGWFGWLPIDEIKDE